MYQETIGADLVGRIVEALRPHLPSGFALRVVGPGCVEYSGPGGKVVTDVRQILLRGDLMNAGYNILSSVQDQVQTDTTEPWPQWPEGFAMPQVRLTSTHLRLWYGSESAIALFVVDYRL